MIWGKVIDKRIAKGTIVDKHSDGFYLLPNCLAMKREFLATNCFFFFLVINFSYSDLLNMRSSSTGVRLPVKTANFQFIQVRCT